MRAAVLIAESDGARAPSDERFERVLVDDLGSDATREASAFLVDESDPEAALRLLRLVRRHPRPSIYLKPTVLLRNGTAVGRSLERDFDGTWDMARHGEAPPGVATEAERLKREADRLGVTGPEGDAELSFRLLRFMATRDRSFVPEPTIEAPSGFRFPGLDPLVGVESGVADTSDLLRALESQRVVEGEFQTKAYACAHCRCGFLNFVEVCPDCGSADLLVDDMVHHFRCGYIAPSRDFERGGDMVCPKCDREMRHVGVDYDKPSLAYDCNECRHRFAEPEVTTSCYRCRRLTPPDMQTQRVVQAYRVTPFGKNAAIHGLDSLFVSVLQERVPVFDYPVFEQLLGAETHRIDRYGRSQSTLLVLSFDGIEQIYVELGERARELFEELTFAFKTVLRESDLLCARNESLFLALLAETDLTRAERAAERLREAVERLLSSALASPPTFSVAMRAIESGLDVDAVTAEVVAGQALPPNGDGPDVS